MSYRELYTIEFQAKLTEIQRLIAEAYEHYFANSDGHCKSAEGAVSIHLPAFFWGEETTARPGVSVYSYVLGPSRNHDFADVDQALAAVREWHKWEMATDHEAGWFE